MELLSVLLVDDEPYVLEGLKMFIPWEQYGFRVCAQAENGEEALEIISREPPDLAIVDIQMPTMDGIELLERISELSEPHPKVIVLSGYSEFCYMREAMRFGVIDYIAKPLYPQEAVLVLQRAHIKVEEEKRARRRLNMCLMELERDDFDAVINMQLVDDEIKERFCRTLTIKKDELLTPLLFKRRGASASMWTDDEMRTLHGAVCAYWGQISSHALYAANERELFVMCPLGALTENDWRESTLKIVKRLRETDFAFTLYVGKPSSVEEGMADGLQSLRDMAASEKGEADSGVVLVTAYDEAEQSEPVAPAQSDGASEAGDGAGNQIKEICAYIDKNFNRELTLNTIAKRYHMNAVCLGRLFKKHMNESFSTYVNNRRMLQAKKLLRNTADSIAQIAKASGFRDASYFTRRFKDSEHMLPTEYREEGMR